MTANQYWYSVGNCGAVRSHTIQSTNLIAKESNYGLHQLRKKSVQIYTDSSSEFSRHCVISLQGRDIVLDTLVFTRVMETKSPLLSFSDSFCLNVLADAEQNMYSASSVVDSIMVLDIRDANSVTILPDSLVDYAVGKDVQTTSISVESLPFNIKVMKLLDLAILDTEVAMRSAVLQAICGLTKAGTRSDMLRTAAAYNTELHLFNYGWSSQSITISGDTSFLATCHHALEAAGFDQLEYISVINTSQIVAAQPLKRVSTAPSPVIGRSPTQRKLSKITSALHRSFTLSARLGALYALRSSDSTPNNSPTTPSRTSVTVSGDTVHGSQNSPGTNTACFSPRIVPGSKAPSIQSVDRSDFLSHQIRKSKEQWVSKALCPLLISLPKDLNKLFHSVPSPPCTVKSSSPRLRAASSSSSPMSSSPSSLRTPNLVSGSNSPTRSDTSSVYSKIKLSLVSPREPPALVELGFSQFEYLLGPQPDGPASGQADDSSSTAAFREMDCGAHMVRNSTGKKRVSQGTDHAGVSPLCGPSSASLSNPSSSSVASSEDDGSLQNVTLRTVPVYQVATMRARTRETVNSVMQDKILSMSETTTAEMVHAERFRHAEQNQQQSSGTRSPSYQFEFDER